ncbi:MAG: T9SS C-terminal target domain-containing protein [Calditrichaeota bacterium]|nr:MAG: T9SS C-terminal target domain-containing protein [Calditrichota bacterium]MBL1207203.1 T9SS C-terminal target domain-containing protein [Calditrichota bacterium]NOG47036.1 T9SS type A sorting domain-containing protein [Calditrichota bacterium]
MIVLKLFLTIITVLLFNSFLTAQENWRLVGFGDFSIEHVYVNGDTIWVSTIDSTFKSEVHYSFTAGDTWNKVSDTDTLISGWLKLIQVNPYNGLIIYARTKKGRGVVSTDAGKAWTVIYPDQEPWPQNTEVTDIYVSPHNKNTLFGIIQTRSGATIDYLYRSNNNGINWEYINGGFPSSSHGSTLVFAYDPVDSTKMYAAIDDKFGEHWFYISNNQGANWNFMAGSVSSDKIIVDWSQSDLIYVFAFPLRSEDGGGSWINANNGLPSGWKYWFSIIDPQDPNVLYMSTKLGVYITINRAELWTLMEGSQYLDLNFSSGVQGKNANLFIDSTTQKLFVGTKKGLYSYNLITSIKKKDHNPKEYKLGQNFPNPFNPSTKINYHLAQNSFVSLKIYDVSGRLIKTLVNQQQNAGEQSVLFDGAGLPSGVYFYRLITSNGFSQSRKMLLLK